MGPAGGRAGGHIRVGGSCHFTLQNDIIPQEIKTIYLNFRKVKIFKYAYLHIPCNMSARHAWWWFEYFHKTVTCVTCPGAACPHPRPDIHILFLAFLPTALCVVLLRTWRAVRIWKICKRWYSVEWNTQRWVTNKTGKGEKVLSETGDSVFVTQQCVLHSTLCVSLNTVCVY